MLIYVNITDRWTDGQTYQKYSSEPHNIFFIVQRKSDSNMFSYICNWLTPKMNF